MTKKLIAISLVYASLFSVLPACKSDGSGAGGGGGAGGSTSTGTVTGTGGCGQCWPQCFLDMFADCNPTGTCTSETGSTAINVCYENGVKMGSSFSATGATMTYYKADGSVCFTGSSTFSATSVTATYKDANGNELLTDTTPISGSSVQTITCGGQTYTVDPDSAACKSCQTGGTSSTCANGTCAIP